MMRRCQRHERDPGAISATRGTPCASVAENVLRLGIKVFQATAFTGARNRVKKVNIFDGAARANG